MLNRWRVRAGHTERSPDRAGSTTRGTPGWTEGPEHLAYSGRHRGRLRQPLRQGLRRNAPLPWLPVPDNETTRSLVHTPVPTLNRISRAPPW